jgi:hypothetical protein
MCIVWQSQKQKYINQTKLILTVVWMRLVQVHIFLVGFRFTVLGYFSLNGGLLHFTLIAVAHRRVPPGRDSNWETCLAADTRLT